MVFLMVETGVIRINKALEKKLKELGYFGESWNDLLGRMADYIESREVEFDEETYEADPESEDEETE